MPELDFMITAEYVRVDNGLLHMLGGGFDTITALQAPATRNIGVGLRLLFTRLECGRDHEVEIAFQSEDGARTAEVRGVVKAAYPQKVPPGWKASGPSGLA